MKKWYKSPGVWLLIQLGVLLGFAIADNFTDQAGYYGGVFLMWVTIPYVVIWLIIGTIKALLRK